MNSRIKRALTIGAALMCVAACTRPAGDSSGAPGITSTAATSATVATVNGKKVTAEMLDVFSQAATGKPIADATPEVKQQLLEQLINMTLASQEAEKNGEANSPATKARLDLLRLQVLASAASEKFEADHPATDAEIQAEYVARVAAMPKEYKARHILVEKKEIAESIIRDLNAGGDFAKLAASESKDAGTASGGGDLGWFKLESMVKPFADAVAALEKGQTTPVPVESKFGWHVIQLEDTRSLEPPPFDQVKDQVKTLVLRKKYQAHLDEIRKAAKIQKS